MAESWYYYAVRKLNDHASYQDGERVITTRKARWVLGQCLNVPSGIQVEVLSELVGLGLLRVVGRKGFVVVWKSAVVE